MGMTPPGHCADCGSDAYIQMAVGGLMLCARCYAGRLGLAKATARGAGERETVIRRAARGRPA